MTLSDAFAARAARRSSTTFTHSHPLIPREDTHPINATDGFVRVVPDVNSSATGRFESVVTKTPVHGGRAVADGARRTVTVARP